MQIPMFYDKISLFCGVSGFGSLSEKMAGTEVKDSGNSIMEKFRNNSDKVYIILTISWIALCAVSYFFLCISPVCGYDESYTISMISHSFSDIVRITSQDVHSPFYYFLVRLFSFLPGIDFIHAPKLFSYVCAIAFLIVSALFIGKKYGRRAALYSVIIAAVSPMMIAQICNGRMHICLPKISTREELLYLSSHRSSPCIFTMFS